MNSIEMLQHEFDIFETIWQQGRTTSARYNGIIYKITKLTILIRLDKCVSPNLVLFPIVLFSLLNKNTTDYNRQKVWFRVSWFLPDVREKVPGASGSQRIWTTAKNIQFTKITKPPFLNCQAQVRSPKSKVPKSRPKGLGLTLKSHGPPPTL